MNNFFNHNFKNNRLSNDQGNFKVDHYIDVEIEDPDEIIEMYYEEMINTDSKYKLSTLATSLFYEGMRLGYKEALLDSLEVKMTLLKLFNDNENE